MASSAPLSLPLALWLSVVSTTALAAPECREHHTRTALSELLDRYGDGGQGSRAAEQLARWPSPCVRKATLALLEEGARRCAGANDPHRPACLRRARIALLLTEVAAITRFEAASASKIESPHLSLAWQCLRAFRAVPEREELLADWLSVASRVALAMGHIGESLDYAQLALAHSRASVQVSITAAMAHESLARLGLYVPMRSANPAIRLGPGDDYAYAGRLPVALGRRRSVLSIDRAEAVLRRAAVSGDDNAEVHLRLGHVLQQQRSLAEAREHLRRVLTLGSSPRERSLALLFLGQIEDGAGAVALAAEHYRQAILAHPESQTAYLALSELLDRQGDSAGARRVAHDTVEHARADTSDWVLYGFGDMEQNLAEVRRLLSQVTP